MTRRSETANPGQRALPGGRGPAARAGRKLPGRGRCPGAVVGLLALLAPLPALGHAALLQAEAATAIRLQATYDTGAPMAAAQVIVYAPDNPARVWSRGTTDAEGRYLFVPDSDRPGRWTVQVRQAGHGAVVHVEIADTPAIAVSGDGAAAGPLQRGVMVALVAWGALGTALWFRRRGAGDASA